MIQSHLRNKTDFPAIIACLLWASAFAGIKIGLKFTTPLNFAGTRFIISGIMILPFAGNIRSYLPVLWKNRGIVILISVLQTFLQYALFYQGIHLVPASVAAVIIGSQPLFIAFIAHFFMPGDKLSLKKLLAFFIGIGGIVLVSFGRNGNGAGSSINFTGVILLVCVNIIAGFSNVLVARDGKKIPPLVLSSSSLMLGGIILLIVSIPLEGLTAMPHPLPYFASLAWLSILSAVAISIWFTLLKLPGAKVSELNFWKFLIPLAGALLAWLIIPGESPNASTIAGMIIIVGSLLIHAAIRGKSREIIGNPD